MKDVEFIKKLIEVGYESDHLDFKKTQYRKENFRDLILDMMSMANSNHKGDKYILVGIKDKPNTEREIIGVEGEFIDDSVYQNLIFDNIEPTIKFEYFSIKIEDKCLGVFKIYATNTDRPYMLKKKYANLNEGLCKVRRGSTNSLATRADFDKFYLSKEKFEVQFMETSLAAVYDDLACARTSVAIRNYTKFPVVLNHGLLTVINKEGTKLSMHPVYGFQDEIIGADFQLTLPPMSEKMNSIYVGFSSTDCLRLGLDQYGYTDEKFRFELVFQDTKENKYATYVEDGFVFAKGKFLWKIQLNEKSKEEPKEKNIFKRALMSIKSTDKI